MARVKHDDLLHAQFVVDTNGAVGVYDRRRPRPDDARLVFTSNSFVDEWYWVMSAAPTMYQTLYQQWVALEACIEINEKLKKAQPLVYVRMSRLYSRMQNQILETLRIATEGSQRVARERQAEQVVKGFRR